ncbi:MAG: methyltransferase [Culicoidibacterales bacterium]
MEMTTMETIFAALDQAIDQDGQYIVQLPTAIAQLPQTQLHYLRQAVSMATMKGMDNFRSDVILPEAIILLIVALVQSVLKNQEAEVLELDAGIGSLSLALLEVMTQLKLSYMEVEPLFQAIFEATASKLAQKVTAVELDETTTRFDLILQNVDMENAAKNWQQLALEYAELLPNLLSDEGHLFIIVPQAVLNEAVFAPLRQTLFEQFHLQAYIQLPNAFFVADDLAKGILILASKAQSQTCEPIVVQLPDPQHQQQFAKSVRDLLTLLAQ